MHGETHEAHSDGKEHPVPDFPGLISIVIRPNLNTLVAEVRREDGSVVGGGTYVVSPDGNLLTATNFGYDTQLRQFKQKTLWERQGSIGSQNAQALRRMIQP